MLQLHVLTFTITRTFSEWAESYDKSIPGQKMAGITSLSRAVSLSDPTQVCAVMLAEPGVLDGFIKDNEELVKASGHVLESTKIFIYSQE